MMRALHFPLHHIVDRANWSPAGEHSGFEQLPGFLRRLADAAFKYQQATDDIYPRAEHDFCQIDKLGGPNGKRNHEYVMFYCDLAEKRLGDPQHPDVLAWHRYMDEHDLR